MMVMRVREKLVTEGLDAVLTRFTVPRFIAGTMRVRRQCMVFRSH